MIQMQTKLNVADNSGAKYVRCIKVLGGSKKMITGVADIIVASVISASPTSDIKKGQIVKCVIVRTKSQIARYDGSFISFDDNAVVLIDNNGEPIGTRVFGPISRELRSEEFMRIVSLAPEVI